MVVGTGAQAAGQSLAIGLSADASQIFNIAIGAQAVANVNFGALALGFQTVAEGSSSTAIGIVSECLSDSAIALGPAASVGIGSSGAIAMGTSASVINSQNSTAVGNQNSMNGASSSACIGASNNISGSSSTAVGNQNQILDDNCIVIGNSLRTEAANQCLIGNKQVTGITEVYLGKGVFDAFPPPEVAIRTTRGFIANTTAQDLVLAPGQGVGTGLSGAVIIRTSEVSAVAGSAVNPLIERFRISKRGVMEVSTGVKKPTREESAAYTVTEYDYNVVFDIATNTICTLPVPGSNTGQEFKIVNKYSSTANLTFSENINGDASFALISSEVVTLIDNGTEYIIGG